jgi:hypothetical protein
MNVFLKNSGNKEIEKMAAEEVNQNSEKEWTAQRDKEIDQKAESLGLSGHPRLAAYLLLIDDRIGRLEEAVAVLTRQADCQRRG